MTARRQLTAGLNFLRSTPGALQPWAIAAQGSILRETNGTAVVLYDVYDVNKSRNLISCRRFPIGARFLHIQNNRWLNPE